MTATLFHWIAFNLVIVILLGMDLWRFWRHPHPIKMKEAIITSGGWILLAFAFNIWIYYSFGYDTALNFLTGYLLEKSLSVDNLFIFLLIFSHFKVPEASKHEVLFYGVLGAIVLRALVIWGGIVLVQYFDWIFIVFGLFLIYTGIHLAFKREDESEVGESYVYKWLRKKMRFTETYRGDAFLVLENGKWLATPLLGVLILIEVTDLIFALDSVPAILGITTDPFIVYTSNILAILGLRSLFFALEGVMKRFWLLHYALAFILVFIGFKMLVANFMHVPTLITLLVIISALLVAIIGSRNHPEKIT